MVIIIIIGSMVCCTNSNCPVWGVRSQRERERGEEKSGRERKREGEGERGREGGGRGQERKREKAFEPPFLWLWHNKREKKGEGERGREREGGRGSGREAKRGRGRGLSSPLSFSAVKQGWSHYFDFEIEAPPLLRCIGVEGVRKPSSSPSPSISLHRFLPLPFPVPPSLFLSIIMPQLKDGRIESLSISLSLSSSLPTLPLPPSLLSLFLSFLFPLPFILRLPFVDTPQIDMAPYRTVPYCQEIGIGPGNGSTDLVGSNRSDGDEISSLASSRDL